MEQINTEQRGIHPPAHESYNYVNTHHCNERNDMEGLYVQLMEVCQPFYEAEDSSSPSVFSLPPRLDDAPAIKAQNESQDNPQDPTTVSNFLGF